MLLRSVHDCAGLPDDTRCEQVSEIPRAPSISGLLRARGVVQSALKLPDNARHVPMHGGPRATGVMRGNRLYDCRMIVHRCLRKLAGMEMLLHAPPQCSALFPHPFDDELE